MTLPVLQSDCSSCFALCCVLLPFSAVSGFGVDKPGGRPCLNLLDDDRCQIHSSLRADGWPGCTVFECFGAGQQVSQVTYEGVSWREQDNLAEMGAVLSVMRQLHEMLVHLGEVERRSPDASATAAREHVEQLTGADPESLLTYDLDDLHGRVGQVLTDASARLRAQWPSAVDRTREDLAGRRMSGDHRGESFRGATLIRADLSEADLREVDLLGADLRDADLRGSDLSTAIFVTQPQVNSAAGDARTLLPPGLQRPGHWAG